MANGDKSTEIRKMTATAAKSLSEIEPGKIHTLGAFQDIFGWGPHAMRTARRNGFRVIYTAGRAYVRIAADAEATPATA